MRVFQDQLSTFCNQVQNMLTDPRLLVSVLNSNALLQSSAFNHTVVTVINGTTDCTSAQFITGNFNLTAASTLTLNNVSDAAILDFRISNSSGSGWLLKIAINKPGGGAYSVLVLSALAGLETDMTSTGFTFGTGNVVYFRGMAQLSAGLVALGYF